jgi:hypothetical protein
MVQSSSGRTINRLQAFGRSARILVAGLTGSGVPVALTSAWADSVRPYSTLPFCPLVDRLW